jgi:NIPSNAP
LQLARITGNRGLESVLEKGEAMNRRDVLQGMGAAMMMLPASGLVAQSAGNAGGTVYELRIYHTYPGKLEPLLKRFRERETKIFERLDMHPVGYWTPDDDPLKGNALIYMLRHKSRAAATENWARFTKDPEWVKLKAESEANGAFVEKHDITFMSLTDFSPVV